MKTGPETINVCAPDHIPDAGKMVKLSEDVTDPPTVQDVQAASGDVSAAGLPAAGGQLADVVNVLKG